MKVPARTHLAVIGLIALAVAACAPAASQRRAVALLVKSTDKGATWKPKARLVTPSGSGSIAGANVRAVVFDPSDAQAVYLATENRGLLYTYDGGENWFSPRQVTGSVNAVTIDPNDKCTVYVATGGRVLKSTDCNRTFAELYVDPRPKVQVVAVAVHPLSSALVLFGTSAGEVVQSTSAGGSWATIQRFGKPLAALAFDPQAADVAVAVVPAAGVFRSLDRGATWTDVSAGLKPLGGTKDFRQLAFSPSQPDTLLLLNGYGIIKTEDGGASWEAVNLITPPKSTKIFVVAVSPTTGDEITYGTANQLYRTVNGGETWSFRHKVPFNAQPSALAIDPTNPSVFYLGSRVVEAK